MLLIEISKVVKYVNGELIKDAAEVKKLNIKTEYYNSGSIKKVGSYNSNNIAEGITRNYSHDGKLLSAEVYENGTDCK